MAGDWSRLTKTLGAANPSSCIVAGPAGIGKSCALRLALRSAPGSPHSRISLWLRCTADPNLRDARERIKAISRQRVEDIKWIVLEHADALHTDAQAFLRRILETAVGGTRFILEVRDVGAVAEPLLSRCQLVCVDSPLPFEIRAEVMRRAPGLTLEEAERIVAECDGNVRWAVLQALGRGDPQVAAAAATVANSISGWKELLRAMEIVSETGTVPRQWLQTAVGNTEPLDWERPGGACPWALTANALAAAQILPPKLKE